MGSRGHVPGRDLLRAAPGAPAADVSAQAGGHPAASGEGQEATVVGDPTPAARAAEDDPVRALLDRERVLRAELASIRPRLEQAVLERALALRGDEAGTAALVRHLYWDVPEVAVTVIRVACGIDGKVTDVAGPGPSVGACADCARDLLATSRSDLAQRRRTREPLRCESCQQVAVERWYAEQDEEWEPPDDPLPWYDPWSPEGNW